MLGIGIALYEHLDDASAIRKRKPIHETSIVNYSSCVKHKVQFELDIPTFGRRHGYCELSGCYCLIRMYYCPMPEQIDAEIHKSAYATVSHYARICGG
jgi:hypothetical protein